MTWRHADEITLHTSMVDFVADYQDCIDNRGLEVWWEPDDWALARAADPESAYVLFESLV